MHVLLSLISNSYSHAVNHILLNSKTLRSLIQLENSPLSSHLLRNEFVVCNTHEEGS
jgi:hypothetical protein